MRELKSLFERFRTFAETQNDYIIALRRHFHQYPEVGYHEFETSARLKKELADLSLTLHDSSGYTGFWADLNTGRPGPTIAIRTDIDALPIQETTGLPYASKKQGHSHACGHDVHMAVLVGTARILNEFTQELSGNVRFICQHAEEVPPGGARDLINAGVLKKPAVDAIIALHDDPELPVGHIGVRDGVSMAATFDFDIIVKGKTGHAALPHKAVDAITIASHIVTGIQQIVSRNTDPIEAVAITFGTITGGTVRNGIADRVILQGTARSLSPTITKRLPALIKNAAVNIGKGLGAKVDFIPIAGYPPFISDPRVNAFITEAYTSAFPRGKVHQIEKVLGSEDFACYLEQVPGAMFRLGVRNTKIGADKPWHHSSFIIDEDALVIGAVTMAAATAGLLRAWKGGRR